MEIFSGNAKAGKVAFWSDRQEAYLEAYQGLKGYGLSMMYFAVFTLKDGCLGLSQLNKI